MRYYSSQIHSVGERFSPSHDDTHRIQLYRIPIELVDSIPNLFPRIHCQHDYDCCANWYPQQGRLIYQDPVYGYAIVAVTEYLNV